MKLLRVIIEAEKDLCTPAEQNLFQHLLRRMMDWMLKVFARY